MARRRTVTLLVRGARALALLAAFGVGGAAALLAWLTTDSGNDWLRRQAVARGTGLLNGGTVELAGLRTDLLSELSLDGLALRDGEGHLLLAVRRCGLAYDLRGVFRRQIVVSDLQLEGVEASLGIDDAGALDLLSVLGIEGSDGPSEPWGGVDGHIDVRRLRLVDATLRLTTPTQVIALDGVSIESAVDVDGSTVRLAGLAASAELSQPWPIRLAMHGDAVLVSGDLEVDDLFVSTNQSKAGIAGRVRHVETAPDLDLDVVLQPLAAADVATIAGEPVLSSDVSARFSVQGPVGDLAFEGKVDADCGGLTTRGTAALFVEPPTWTVELHTPGLAVDACVPAVDGPLRLDGRYRAEGTGLSWPDDLAVVLEAEGGRQEVFGEPVNDLRLRGELRDGVLRLDAAEAGLAVGRASVSGEVRIEAGTAGLRGSVELPDLALLQRYGVDDLAGRATVAGTLDLDWSGDGLELGLAGNVSGHRLALAGVSVGRASGPVQVAVDGDDFDASGTTMLSGVSASGLHVATGTSTWSTRSGGGSVEFSTAVTLLGLAAEPGVQLANLDGEVSGAIGADGTVRMQGRTQVGTVSLDPELGVGVAPLDGGPLSFGLDGDELSLDLDLRRGSVPGLRVLGAGDLASGEWRAEEVAVAVTPDLLLESSSPIRLTLADDGLRDVEAVVDAVRLSPDGEPTAQGRVQVDGDLLATEPDATVRLDGLSIPFVVAIASLVPSDDPDSEPLDPLAWGGLIDGEASLRGAGDAPEVAADLSVLSLSLPDLGRPIDLHLSASGSARRPFFDITARDRDRLLLAAQGEAALDGAGLDCAGDLVARVIVPPVDSRVVGELFLLRDVQPGQVAVDLVAHGSPCDPDLELVASGRAPLGVSGDEVRVDTKLVRSGAALVLDGTVEESLVRRGRFSGSASTQAGSAFAHLVGAPGAVPAAAPDVSEVRTWVDAVELDVIPLALPLAAIGRFVDLPPDIDGRLAGGLHLSGDPLRPALSGGLLVVDGRMGTVTLPMAFLGIAPLEGGQRLDAQVAFAGGGGLSASADLPDAATIAASETRLPLAISIDGDGVPMAALAAVIDGMGYASGLLVVRGTVGGSFQRPEPDLQLSTRDAALSWVGGGVRYDHVDADLRLVQDVLHVDRLDVANRRIHAPVLRPGRLGVRGTVAVDGVRPSEVDLAATMDDFWLAATRTQTTALSGALAASGPWPTLTVRGDLALAEGRFELDDQFFLDQSNLRLDPAITIYRPRGVSVEQVADETPPVWESFDLDVHLDLQRNLHLVADVPTYERLGREVSALSRFSIDGDLDGDVRIQQSGSTGGALVLQGEVEAIRGTATVLGAPFQLGEGHLYFLGDSYDNPILDLWATRRAGADGDVTVHITGNIAETRLEFESDQYDDQTDIVSLLLFGVPASDLGEAQGGAAMLSVELASVSGQVGRAVGNRVVDQFELDPGAGAVRVGKALSDSLFLTSELKSTTEPEENQFEVTIEWLITRRMYAEFVTGDSNQSAADLYYRWRF